MEIGQLKRSCFSDKWKIQHSRGYIEKIDLLIPQVKFLGVPLPGSLAHRVLIL